MKIEHEKAYETAKYQQNNSNLARSYLELRKLVGEIKKWDIQQNTAAMMAGKKNKFALPLKIRKQIQELCA